MNDTRDQPGHTGSHNAKGIFMYELIGTQYLGEHFVLRQGSTRGAKISVGRFDDLAHAGSEDRVPAWLTTP